MSVALLFHAYGFRCVVLWSAFTLQGPFSWNSATPDEHPGPPVIQSTTGSVATFERLSNIQ